MDTTPLCPRCGAGMRHQAWLRSENHRLVYDFSDEDDVWVCRVCWAEALVRPPELVELYGRITAASSARIMYAENNAGMGLVTALTAEEQEKFFLENSWLRQTEAIRAQLRQRYQRVDRDDRRDEAGDQQQRDNEVE